MSASPSFAEVFAAIEREGDAPAGLVRAAFEQILAGAWTPVQVAGLAVSLRLRGETPAIIAEAARAMRDAMVPVEHDLDVVLDTCGTGGDGLATVNVSTAAAIVVAACGVPVAKHGNRAVSSRSGSADVLEALGVALDVPADLQANVLAEAGIAFLYAPAHHPAMRHGGVARRELGIRTIFNALGPLANPARATHQLLGAYDDALRPALARTLGELGTRRAWVVRGEDGLDEVSPTGPTRVSALDRGEVTELRIAPEDFGLARSRPEAIRGGDAAENAATTLSILRGERHPARDAVVLNAAAALVVARDAAPRDAAAMAADAIAAGRALATFERWRALARAAKESR